MADDLQELAIKRLSRLHRLEELRLKGYGPLSWGIRFSLEQGLEQLSTLTRLKTVEFGSGLLIRSVQEVDWMVDHWKCLITVRKMRVFGGGGDATLHARFRESGVDFGKSMID